MWEWVCCLSPYFPSNPGVGAMLGASAGILGPVPFSGWIMRGELS